MALLKCQIANSGKSSGLGAEFTRGTISPPKPKILTLDGVENPQLVNVAYGILWIPVSFTAILSHLPDARIEFVAYLSDVEELFNSLW